MNRFWTSFKHSFLEKDNYIEDTHEKLVEIGGESASFRELFKVLEKSHFYNDSIIGLIDLHRVASKLPQGSSVLLNDDIQYTLAPVWSSVLKIITDTNEKVLSVIKARLQQSSETLLTLSLPFTAAMRQPDKRSLSSAAYYSISECLKDWDDEQQFLFDINTMVEDKTPLSRQLTDDTLVEEDGLTMLQNWNRQFQQHYQKLESRLEYLLQMHKTGSKKLERCIKCLYQLRTDLCVHHYYLSSHFILLSELIGRIAPLITPRLDGKEKKEEEPSKPASDLQAASLLVDCHVHMQQQLQQMYTREVQSCATFQRQARTILAKSLMKLEIDSSSSSSSQESLKCTICLSMYSNPITLSSCQHTFCRDCIQRMFCDSCYHNRKKLLNRLSMRISHIIYHNSNPFSMPSIYCHCSCIDTRTGDIIPIYQREKSRTKCPLCRTTFKPEDCILNAKLAKIIQRHFSPQQKEEADADYKDTVVNKTVLQREKESIWMKNRKQNRNLYSSAMDYKQDYTPAIQLWIPWIP